MFSPSKLLSAIHSEWQTLEDHCRYPDPDRKTPLILRCKLNPIRPVEEREDPKFDLVAQQMQRALPSFRLDGTLENVPGEKPNVSLSFNFLTRPGSSNLMVKHRTYHFMDQDLCATFFVGPERYWPLYHQILKISSPICAELLVRGFPPHYTKEGRFRLPCLPEIDKVTLMGQALNFSYTSHEDAVIN